MSSRHRRKDTVLSLHTHARTRTHKAIYLAFISPQISNYSGVRVQGARDGGRKGENAIMPCGVVSETDDTVAWRIGGGASRGEGQQ